MVVFASFSKPRASPFKVRRSASLGPSDQGPRPLCCAVCHRGSQRKGSRRSDGSAEGKLLLAGQSQEPALTLAVGVKLRSFSWALLRGCPSKALWARDRMGHSWRKGSWFGFDISVVVIFIFSLFWWYFKLLGKAHHVQNRCLAIDLQKKKKKSVFISDC